MHYRALDPPKVSTLPSGDLDATGQYRKYGRKSYCLPLPRASVSNFASVHKMVTPLDRIFHHPSQLSPHQLADMNDDAYKIHLPLETLNKCSFCNKEPVEKKLCSACGERLYCSQECNIADWKQHKINCGQTDRIDLAQFYPFLSWMCASSYINPSRPLHPALTWKIMNNVNPDTPPVQLPDGSYAKLVMLDDTHTPDLKLAADPINWCPQAESQDIARKLSRRLLYSGNLLPITTAVATSIFVEMYTTTSGSDPSLGYRKRLQYGSSPISDFGIAMGSVKVTPQDRLAFLRKSNGTISYEQDSDNHYWIYFTTARGKEITLDCGLFHHNMCEVVDTDPYVDPSMPTHPDYDVRVGWAPSHISGPFITKRTPALYKERKRLSMLRNPGLQNAAGIFARAYIDPSDDGWDISEAELKPFHDYMEALAGKPLSRIDKSIFKRFTPIHCFSMHYVLSRQVWKNFPKEPQLGIQEDPGDDANDRDEKYKRWRKEQREIKKGSL